MEEFGVRIQDVGPFDVQEVADVRDNAQFGSRDATDRFRIISIDDRIGATVDDQCVGLDGTEIGDAVQTFGIDEPLGMLVHLLKLFGPERCELRDDASLPLRRKMRSERGHEEVRQLIAASRLHQ